MHNKQSIFKKSKISGYLLSMLVFFIMCLVIPKTVHATVLFDSYGFEAPTYSLGNLAGQNGWVSDGGSNFSVQNSVVKDGSQAVSLPNNISEWHWVDLSYTAESGRFVRASADMMRGSPGGNFINFGYLLDAYTISVERICRAGLGVDGGNPNLTVSYIGPSGSANYVIETGLSWNTWYNIKIDFNFETQKCLIYRDGVLKGEGGFIVTTNNLGDVDISKSFTSGATDIGYVDNYKIESLPFPEDSPPTITRPVKVNLFSGILNIFGGTMQLF